MEIVPATVGRVSCGWDEQHLDLEGAATLLEAADAAGFTDAVRATAGSFATAWEGFTRRLARDAEAHADGLRQVIHTYLTSDDHIRARLGSFGVEPLSVRDVEVP